MQLLIQKTCKQAQGMDRSAAMAEWFTGGNYEPYTQREALIPIQTYN